MDLVTRTQAGNSAARKRQQTRSGKKTGYAAAQGKVT